MDLTPIIAWVDRQWDAYPNAKFWLLVLLAPAIILVMSPGRTAFTIALGAIWGLPILTLFIWRWAGWIGRLDARSRRSRERRRRKDRGSHSADTSSRP
ncbi:hypothetical protein [Brevundimonas sp.]|uniref:hypothetical protein n=1 Tax=Brevundimonas sp. TaxID=1871086 RepID=UPI002FCB957E